MYFGLSVFELSRLVDSTRYIANPKDSFSRDEDYLENIIVPDDLLPYVVSQTAIMAMFCNQKWLLTSQSLL